MPTRRPPRPLRPGRPGRPGGQRQKESKQMPRAKAKTTRKPRAKSRAASSETPLPRLSLHDLRAPQGSHRARIRKGRGPGSGIGKTAGRGGKGQTARQGGHVRPGFEGGQMPLIRRIPKRGFTNPFKKPAQVVNVRHLVLLAEGVEVTPETLFGAGLVRRPDRPIKLLGTGEVSGRKFVVKGVAVSASAKQKIEQAGGTIA